MINRIYYIEKTVDVTITTTHKSYVVVVIFIALIAINILFYKLLKGMEDER